MKKSELTWMPVKSIKPYDKNPRKNDPAVESVANSIEEFGFQNPVIVDKDMTIIAGHTRWKAAKKLGLKEIPVVVASELTEDQANAFRLVDNRTAELADWDWDMLIDEIDNIEIDLSDFGFTLTDDGSIDFDNLEKLAGEKDENYEAFVDKFKPKHTTDDCFTPPEVYEAVKGWVLKHYGIPESAEIVRPFYPGGDYEKFAYPDGCIVLDNPPFSIMADIVRFYQDRHISFFLFGQATTAFQHIASINVVLIGISIVYENGALVPTGFITNLGDSKVTISAELSDLLAKAQPSESSEVGAYDWPDNIISGALTGRLAKFGTNMEIKRVIPKKTVGESKQAIFGGGALVSDRDAEKLKAEKLKAEKERVPIILTAEERKAIADLGAEE